MLSIHGSQQRKWSPCSTQKIQKQQTNLGLSPQKQKHATEPEKQNVSQNDRNIEEQRRFLRSIRKTIRTLTCRLRLVLASFEGRFLSNVRRYAVTHTLFEIMRPWTLYSTRVDFYASAYS